MFLLASLMIMIRNTKDTENSLPAKEGDRRGLKATLRKHVAVLRALITTLTSGAMIQNAAAHVRSRETFSPTSA